MRKQEFNSKLISLLPLDEVPVHVPLRRPRPLRFERLRVSGSECGIHTAEAASALRSRKTEKGGEGKTDANLTIFLSTCRATRRSESFGTAPEQQCGGANSSLVAAQVLVKPHVAVAVALDLWSELPKQLRPLNSVLAVRSLPQLGSVLSAMGLSRVLRI